MSDPVLVKLFTDALSLQVRGEAGSALLSYKRLQRQFPDFPDAWTNASVLLCAMGRLEEALAAAERAVALDGGNQAAVYALACARMGLGCFAEAAEDLRRVLEIAPDHVPALTNLAAIRAGCGDLGEAIRLHDRAVSLNPSSSAIVGRRGHAKVRALDMEGAEADLRRALELDAGNEDAALALVHVWLRTYRYSDAWRHFKARQHLTELAINAKGFGRPFWKGGAIGNANDVATLLVYSERGFGDTIQFSRFLPQVRETSGARVLLSVYKPLARLMDGVPGADAVVLQDGPLPAFDYVVPITELPVILEIDPSNLPPPVRVNVGPSQAPELDRPGFKIGLVWAGSPEHAADAERSIAPRLLDELASIENVAWYGLQVPPSAEPPRLPGFLDMSPRMADFMDTAQIVGQMNLVVTVDTSMAHLAGTLGVPTIVLLAHLPEWRWGLGDATPWYPSAKLIKQPAPGDWSGVIEKLKREIADRIK